MRKKRKFVIGTQFLRIKNLLGNCVFLFALVIYNGSTFDYYLLDPNELIDNDAEVRISPRTRVAISKCVEYPQTSQLFEMRVTNNSIELSPKGLIMPVNKEPFNNTCSPKNDRALKELHISDVRAAFGNLTAEEIDLLKALTFSLNNS